MAVKTSRVRRAVGTAGIAGSFVLGLIVAPTVAYADPAADKAAVHQQIIQTQHEVEEIAEQYNDAKIKLAELNEAKKSAQAAADAADAALQAEQVKIARTGASMYKSPTLSDATTIMTATTPQEIIDKLNTLTLITAYYGDTVAGFKARQSAASATVAEAEKATEAAAAKEQELAAKKAEIESKLPALESQLAALSDAERAAVFAQAGGHAQEGSSAQPTVQTVNAGTGGSSTAQGAVDAALSRVGMPYKWAAAGPTAFDCSGLTMWAYAQVGVSLPHSSSAQASSGTSVPLSAVAPGDILWMPGHVGMYIGNGQVVHAPTSGDVVKVVAVGSMSWQKAVRIA